MWSKKLFSVINIFIDMWAFDETEMNFKNLMNCLSNRWCICFVSFECELQ